MTTTELQSTTTEIGKELKTFNRLMVTRVRVTVNERVQHFSVTDAKFSPWEMFQLIKISHWENLPDNCVN